MVYIWRIPEDYPEKCMGGYEYKKSPNRFIFSKGDSITAPPVGIPIVTFECGRGQLLKYDALVNGSTAPIVNEKLRKIFDDICPNDVQYFDVNIQCKDGILEDYKILNVTHSVKAIDHEHTKCNYIFGSENAILGFDHLTLYPNSLEKAGLHIARNIEYKSHILVSQKLHSVLKENKIKGTYLMTVDELNSI